MMTKQAEQCRCGARHWWVGIPTGGEAPKTCRVCGEYGSDTITEIELYLGVPTKPNSYAYLNAVSGSRNCGLSVKQKSELYKENKEQMIALYKKDGDVAVLKAYPIHISTWNKLKKTWKVAPNEDRRITANQWRGKPAGKQLLLV